jgi:polar amino acid transport system substrate-binding protein
VRFLRLLSTVVLALPVAACSMFGPPASPSTPPALACIDSVALKHSPRLTLSTDNPASPPWWGGDPSSQFPNEPSAGSGWKGGEPYSMEGFEGGVSYSLGNALGYEYDEIDWVPSGGLAQAYAPGPKPYDFLIAHVPLRADHADAVDFSQPYFESYQSVLALESNGITAAASVADLKGYRLGAIAGSSGAALIDTVVHPTAAPTVYPDTATALGALKAKEVDGLVVDINTAFYLKDGWHEGGETPPLLPEGAIVGQFPSSVWVDQFAVVLEKGSALTPCVNAAIDQIRDENFLAEYREEYIIDGEDIPEFK